MKTIVFLFVFLISSLVQAEFPKSMKKVSLPGTYVPPDIFSSLYPYYYKFCASTQRTPREGQGGGVGGHAFMFLSRVCIDQKKGRSHLSPLIMCEDLPEYKSNPRKLKDSDLGTGVTVDSYLKNTIFMNIPGLKLFLGVGLLDGKEVLDKSMMEKISKYALNKGAVNGIQLHDSPHKKYTDDVSKLKEDERYLQVAKIAFGTDIAISYGRNLYCVNIPLNRRLMRKLVKETNENRKLVKVGNKYRGKFLVKGVKKDKVFKWDMFYKNCTHLAVNSMAKITGVFPPILTDLPLFKQFNQIAIPANYFVEISDVLNNEPINVDEYWDDKAKRRVFEESVKAGEGGWIAQQPGTIVEEIPLYGTIGNQHAKKVKNDINLIHKNNDNILQLSIIKGSRTKGLKEKFILFKKRVMNPFKSAENLKEWFDEYRTKDFSFKARMIRYTTVGDDPKVSYRHPQGKRDYEGLNKHYRFYLSRYYKAINKVAKRRKSRYYQKTLALSKKGDPEASHYIKFIDQFERYLLKKKKDVEQFLK
jgi:hypothetical protein